MSTSSSMSVSGCSDVSDIPSLLVRRGVEPPCYQISSRLSITTSACSEVSWDPFSDECGVRAADEVEIDDFVFYSNKLLGCDWWLSLDCLPSELRHHLSLMVHHVKKFLVKRRKLHINEGEQRGIAYATVLDAMQESFAYGTAVLISLYKERMVTRTKILPCDLDIPMMARENTRLSVSSDSVKIHYFTEDWEPFRSCTWTYGHHRCV